MQSKDIAVGGKLGSVLRAGRPRGGRRRWTWGAARSTRTRCASAPVTSARLGRCSTGVRGVSGTLLPGLRDVQVRPAGAIRQAAMMALPAGRPMTGGRFPARLAQQLAFSQFERCGEVRLLFAQQLAHKCTVVPRLPCISHRPSSSSCLP